jgi:hypothetical protein
LSAPSEQLVSLVSVTVQGTAQEPPEQIFPEAQVLALQLVSAQSIAPSQSLSNPSPQLDSVDSGAPPLPVQLQAPLVQRSPKLPQLEVAQLESPQSVAPSQSLSRPSPQLVSVLCGEAPFPEQTQAPPEQEKPFAPQLAAAQFESAQSTAPSQSLSAPSPQLVSVAWAGPPFPVQAQALPEHLRPLAPQVTDAQFESAQSTAPSQSLSRPSEQLVSLLCGGAPLPEQVQLVPLQDMPLAPQAREEQSESAQSVSPSQSLSLASPQLASALSGAPPLPEQAQPVAVH